MLRRILTTCACRLPARCRSSHNLRGSSRCYSGPQRPQLISPLSKPAPRPEPPSSNGKPAQEILPRQQPPVQQQPSPLAASAHRMGSAPGRNPIGSAAKPTVVHTQAASNVSLMASIDKLFAGATRPGASRPIAGGGSGTSPAPVASGTAARGNTMLSRLSGPPLPLPPAALAVRVASPQPPSTLPTPSVSGASTTTAGSVDKFKQ
jgi:hypothetical protein